MTNSMTIAIWAYYSGLYTNFVSYSVEKILSNLVLFLFQSNHVLFCSQVIAVINEIEKSTQRNLNFIFYEISEYANFFCLKMFLS